MVLEDIEKEFDQEDSKFWKIIKKIFVIVMALFLIILILTYLVPGNNLISIIEGRFVSAPINEDFTVSLDNGGKVIFENEVYEKLKIIYFEEQKHEFKVCLIGDKIGNSYFIDDLEKPKILSHHLLYSDEPLLSRMQIN